MSLMIEVDSIDKGCKVIVNIENALEIAPLRAGGCDIFFADSAGTGGRISMKVKDDYAKFAQFCLQTVSAEDIAAKFKSKKV